MNTKSAASSFLDQLIADPLNPDLCRQFGVEIVPIEVDTTPARETLVYVQGVGYVSRRYATLREQLKSLVKLLAADNLNGHIINEDTGRVQIIVSGPDKPAISAQKVEIANRLRALYPGVKMFNSKTRGYAIWNCYFSDGNFNTYAGGVEFDMPLEIVSK